MRKLLIAFIALGVIFGASIAGAVTPPTTVTVDSYLNGCTAYNGCLPAGDRGIPATSIYKEFFPTGQYTFTVSSGYWAATTAHGNSWINPRGFWSMNFFNDDTQGDFDMLGSFTDYTSGPDALAAHVGDSVTFNVVDYNGTGGSVLGFYVEDHTPRSNFGEVTIDIAVAPEPVSTTLFIIGGVVLGGRSFLKRKRSVK